MMNPASSVSSNAANRNVNAFGFYIAILTAALTLGTFVIAFLTPPLSGPGCTGSCFTYPYADVASRFPRDYWWMYPAILLSIIYFVLIACIHQYAPQDKKIYSYIGSSFALISAAVLIIDYFVQVSVVQPSLVLGETEGIALITQFNPHGIFIVLEEVGYFLMSIAFLFLAPVFSGQTRTERAIRWTFVIDFILAILALIFFAVQYGIFREYYFEIAIISINWIALVISGVLLAVIFRRAMNLSS